VSSLLPNVDPEGLLEYSVVYTDRALNHMSKSFQGVMKEISRVLKQVYNAKSAVVVPGSGTFGMEAVARQFATDKKVLVIRNGWFSFRWTQIFDMGRIPSEQIVLKARQPEPGSQKPFAPVPVKEVVAAILEHKPAVVFAPQVETSAGMQLPDDYLREVAAAVREVDGLFVVDAIAAGTLWVDMGALGIDIVVSAPQKGWSGSPCAGLVMLGERARARIDSTTSTSYAADLKKWLQIMETYEGGGHAYHATLPTDALTRLRDVMLETEAFGFDKVKANQIELGRRVRALLEAKGLRQRCRARLPGTLRGRQLHGRSGYPERQEIHGPGPADRCRRAAAGRRTGRLPQLPRRPVRPRQAAERRAHRAELRRGAGQGRLTESALAAGACVLATSADDAALRIGLPWLTGNTPACRSPSSIGRAHRLQHRRLTARGATVERGSSRVNSAPPSRVVARSQATTVLLDDTVADGQPQPCSLADRLGGEEGFEDAGHVFVGNARAVVAQDHAYVVAIDRSRYLQPCSGITGFPGGWRRRRSAAGS
jgi:aspartate aminotransferase-like enzyme